MFDTVYCIRKEIVAPETGVGRYTIAKFSSRKEPDKVYTVKIHPEGWHQCSCPARKGPDDKHVLMVLRWIQRGQPFPAILDEKGNVL